ncbi:MAG: Rpn family recombination-promoting nuclease/putative transposase [Eubacteriaceae bacterium]|nr:Rpn family recombination-promoting nuclease/putative transposase [Eubacteriaceae bacterium]
MLKNLVACSLGLQEVSIDEIVVANPEILPELIESKFCRLDINMVVGGKHVDIELQVANEGNFKERAMFYLSKMFNEMHSEFAWLERKRHELLSDKMSMHFYEMGKLPAAIDLADGMQVWHKILRVESEQGMAELEKIKNEVDIVGKTLDGYKKITDSAEYRELERMREKIRFDESNALRSTEKKALKEAARKLLRLGIPIETVSEGTGLTLHEIEQLQRPSE